MQWNDLKVSQPPRGIQVLVGMKGLFFIGSMNDQKELVCVGHTPSGVSTDQIWWMDILHVPIPPK
jgi:hypothetical protein